MDDEYTVAYTGELTLVSSSFTMEMFEAAGIPRFAIHNYTNALHISIHNEYINGFNLEETLACICNIIYKRDPSAKVSGKIFWEGSADEDYGYVEVTDNHQEVFVGLRIYVPEDDYEPVVDLINRYLDSDMKELIAQGVKHEEV